MSVLIILILASLTVAGIFLGAFIWAVRSGQYEDTFTPSMRILMEDAPQSAMPPTKKPHSEFTRQPNHRTT